VMRVDEWGSQLKRGSGLHSRDAFSFDDDEGEDLWGSVVDWFGEKEREWRERPPE